MFATGTPISNTMCEMYVMQLYLQKAALEEMGIYHFDSWAANFGEVTTALELTVEGSGFRFKSRFNKFTNLPELMNIFREVADVQTADMLDLDVPALRGGKPIIVESEPDWYVKQAYDSSQMVNFYPSVAMIVREVRKKSNLYGNYIDASKYNEENRFKQDSENAIYMFDKDNGEPEVLDETEDVESAGDVAETAATAEAVEDISDAADTQDLSDDLLYYDSAIGRDNMLGGIVILKGSKISRSEANSCPEGAKKKRNSSLLDGSITDDGEYYVLQKDMEFKSLSGAACFVSGTSVNGKLAWKSGKKNEKTVGKSSSGVRSTGVSSKINQICMVIEKVNQENKPIENYTKTLQNIYGAVASELNISKSPVVDKCNRQLGLTAMEFAKYVRDYSEEGKDTLYDIVMNAAGNEDEKALIRKTFKKN